MHIYNCWVLYPLKWYFAPGICLFLHLIWRSEQVEELHTWQINYFHPPFGFFSPLSWQLVPPTYQGPPPKKSARVDKYATIEGTGNRGDRALCAETRDYVWPTFYRMCDLTVCCCTRCAQGLFFFSSQTAVRWNPFSRSSLQIGWFSVFFRALFLCPFTRNERNQDQLRFRLTFIASFRR